MKTKVIVVEFRPNRKSEKGLYGLTETEDGLTRIFINQRQSMPESVNTFFHEVAHAYMHWFGSGLSEAKQEEIARLVGNVVEPCFRRYKHGQTSEYKRTGKH